MPSSHVRKAGLALAVTTVLIAVFVTQWRFHYDLTSAGVHRRWARIDWSWFPRTGRGAIRLDRDFALNLVMLVPLGIGFGMWRRTRGFRLVAEALLLGLVTSIVLELAQLLTTYRYTSFPDVWRNALGCMLGCVLVLVIRERGVPRASGP